MSRTITIPKGERGRVRVFSLSMSPEEAAALKDDGSALQQALGTPVDATQVEVFALSDLGDMHLADYLIEGPGVASNALEADRAKLAALEGWVIVAYSNAFGGTDGPVTPDARLTLIGTYPQEGVDWSDRVDLSTPSALPNQDDARPQRKKPSDAAIAGRVATAALLVLFALVGLMVWVGG